MTSKRTQGFTLIEAAVAIAVVAILSGIIVPLVVKNINDSQMARARNDVQVIAAAIASQMKDTGTRPKAAANTYCIGTANAIWASSTGTVCPNAPALAAYQTFNQLFCGNNSSSSTSTTQSAAATINLLYGTTAGQEFSYKGPYMAYDSAIKGTPWGGRYYIFGYNANGQSGNTPIWVVCPGPDNQIDTTVNPVATSAGLLQTWTQTGLSADDIAIRVN